MKLSCLFLILLVLIVPVSYTPQSASRPPTTGPTIRPWSEPHLNHAYLHKAWETAGRDWIHSYSGVKWVERSRKWEIDQGWPYRETDVGPRAYYIEYTTQMGIHMGQTCKDIRLLNELAEFYKVYANRFTTLGAMRRRKSKSLDTDWLKNQGDDSARTLVWIQESEKGKRQIGENALYNTQFFHPAAKLIRVITQLPESERTPAMRDFVRLYAPLIVREHLLRFIYQAEWTDETYGDLVPRQLFSIWTTILSTTARPALSWQHGMFDWDLWLIATSAEMLGANANSPALVPLTQDDKSRLQRAVQVGVSLFQQKRTLYPDTKNFRGEVVGSASYFNGVYDDHPDMAYSGYATEAFPPKDQKRPRQGASWDISHFYRVPIFLRSLYDNRRATGVDFPSVRDIELVTNQFMYKMFRGDFQRPLFNNFFDGSNGWYLVTYEDTPKGHPPAQYCDSRTEDRWCLGQVGGAWGLLASFNLDVVQLYYALANLAAKQDAQAQRFRDQYYFYNQKSFAFLDSDGQTQYPILLFWTLSGLPEKLHGCAKQD